MLTINRYFILKDSIRSPHILVSSKLVNLNFSNLSNFLCILLVLVLWLFVFSLVSISNLPEYNILCWGLIWVLYIFKTTLTSLEIIFLPIQPTIQFALNTINKIWLSALNVSSKPAARLHSSFTFWFPCCLIYIQIWIFWYPIFSTSNFLILDFNFQISSQYDNLFRSICVLSFDSYHLTSRLTSSAKKFYFWFYINYQVNHLWILKIIKFPVLIPEKH